MGLAHVISPGEREWFRRCRRAWEFGSPNRRNLVPRDSSTGADLTLAVRKAMAVWYFPGMWEWPRAIVLPRALQAFDEAVAHAAMPNEAVEDARAMLERYFAWAPTVDAFAPVRVEADFEAGVPDPRTPGHELVDGVGRPVRYRDRMHGLIVDASDAYWAVEHRLTEDGWADVDELLLAERPLAAAWGWEQFYLMEFAGTVHNELRLSIPVPQPPHPGSDPAPNRPAARRPRARDWARSRAAERRAGREAPAGDGGTAVVAVDEGGDGLCRRTWIRRSRSEMNAVADHLFGEACDMLDPDLRPYPSPMPEHCGRCDYRTPCLAMNQGTNVDAVLEESYRLREEDGPEEGRLGGGSWSMNRGAAPPPQWRKPPS